MMHEMCADLGAREMKGTSIFEEAVLQKATALPGGISLAARNALSAIFGPWVIFVYKEITKFNFVNEGGSKVALYISIGKLYLKIFICTTC